MTDRYREALGRSSFGTQEVRQMRANVSNKQIAAMVRKLADKRTPTRHESMAGTPSLVDPAPILAAEVIRLREGIEALKGRCEEAAAERFSPEEYEDVGELIQDINLATAYRLTRILEGYQA